MRILFLSQLIPYPMDAGPKVRIFHVLQYLAAAGHDVTLLAFRRPQDSPEQIEHMRQFCRQVHTVAMPRSRARDLLHLSRSLVGRQPFLIVRDEVSEMHRLVQRIMAGQEFDAIHADQLWMAQYAFAAAKLKRKNGKTITVMDQHNAVHLIPERMAATTRNPLLRAILSLESRKISRYEIQACREFDHVVWVTEEDRRKLSHGVDKPLSSGEDFTIPICVDPEHLTVLQRPPDTCRITFLGGMHWPPNHDGVVWFTTEIWPRIRENRPDARLTIIGKDPPARLTALAAEGGANGEASGLEVLGYVDDPTPYLCETAVFVVPLRAGGGMRVKILDAWARGLPIVSTSVGAEGLLYRDGRELLVADDAEQFSSAVIRLLNDGALASTLAQAGRQKVLTSYNWRNAYRAWDRIYRPT